MCPATVLTAHGMHGQYDTMPLLSDVRVFTSREAYLKSTSICKRGRDRAKQRERASRSRARERESAQNRERMSKTERERAKHTHTHRERERERARVCQLRTRAGRRSVYSRKCARGFTYNNKSRTYAANGLAWHAHIAFTPRTI